MTANSRIQRLLALFEAAADLPAVEQARYLDAECAGDAILRAEVEAMLRADATTQTLPTTPTDWLHGQPTPPPEEEDLSQLRFGPWQATGVLGRGGMGAVYRVERVDGSFRQSAALKRVRVGLDTPDAQQRFRRERQILATLRHPNIARLLDGGLAGETPWFAMELVEGERIDHWCDRQRLDVRARVGLFLQVLSAVAEAHRRLVVHRDLKASNVLVDANGHARLLDFGIAQVREEGAAEHTLTFARAFTPDYASPEQLHDEPVTTASDVYQLGLMLYMLLCGRHPFGIDPGTPWHRKLTLLAQPPTPASKALDVDAAATRGSTPQALSRQMSGDLEAILLRAMERSPALRYASVDAMASDLRAWLDGREVMARMPGQLERLSRTVKRNRIAVAAGAAVALALFFGLGAAMWEAQRANRNERMARMAQDAAERSARQSSAIKETFERMLMHSMMHDGGRQTSVREMIDGASRSVDTNSGRGDGARVSLLLDMVKIYTVTSQRDAAIELLNKVRPRAIALSKDWPMFPSRMAALDADMFKMTDPRATEAYRKALALAQPHLAGADDSEFEDYRLTAANLLNTLETQGRYREQLDGARTLYQQTVKRYGERSPRTLQTTIHLVRSLNLSDRFSEALPLAEQATRYAATHFGELSQQSTSGQSALAVIESHRPASWDSAERRLRSLMVAFANPRVDISGERGLRARITLTRLLQLQRRDDEVRTLLDDSDEQFGNLRGDPSTPAYQMQLGTLRSEQAWLEGRVLESRAQAAAVTTIPWDPGDAESALMQVLTGLMLARADADAGHCAAATRETADALKLRASFPQVPEPSADWLRATEVLLRCGQLEQAAKLDALSRADLRNIETANSLQRGRVMLTHARVLRAARNAGAAEAYRDADTQLSLSLPPTHPLRQALAAELGALP